MKTGHAIRLFCPSHDGMVGRAPEHCTLTVSEGVLILVGLCPDCGVTVDRPVFGPMLPAILTLPVLVDPDVRDMFHARKKATR